MTTHYLTTFTNSAGKVFQRASCGKRSSFRRHLTYTSNKAEVDCEKCAAAVGFEPKAKKQSKFRTGTCQCCFNSQKVSKADGKLMSLHGYERPGNGYILGECRGQEQQPYEVSCEKTKQFKAEIVVMRTNQQNYLNRLNANEIEALGTKIERPRTEEEKQNYLTQFKTMYEMVSVKRGEDEKPNPFYPDSPWIVVPSFEKLRTAAIANTEQIIRQMTRDIDFLGEKITSWKQVWES